MGHNHSAAWPWTPPTGTPGSRKNRTYQLPIELIARVQETAQRLQVYPSHLVETLLEQSLNDIEAGGLVVEKVPIVFTLRVKPRSAG